jgi:hypothetical protein
MPTATRVVSVMMMAVFLMVCCFLVWIRICLIKIFCGWASIRDPSTAGVRLVPHAASSAAEGLYLSCAVTHSFSSMSSLRPK